VKKLFVLAAAAAMSMVFGGVPARADTTIHVMSWEPSRSMERPGGTRVPEDSRLPIPA